MTLKRIVSGGQTGVDRGALDAALAADCDCGGWCPAGRKAEDGPIPPRYPVRALDSGRYAERTVRNLEDSDGTLILYRRSLDGGTELTRNECVRRDRPWLALDADDHAPGSAAGVAAAFVDRYGIETLNVAGPRASKWPGGHDHAEAVIAELIRLSRRRARGRGRDG
jgi:hypothetical protein